MPPQRFTPNQAVAWNLARARTMRGWTQEQAAERLEPYLGEHWTKATFSVAERSVDGRRVRQFTADDLFAFSRAFDVPMTYFLCPPSWTEELEVGHASGGETSTREDYLDLIFDVGPGAPEWLLRQVVPMGAQTTRALRRWGRNFAAMVAHRDREVEDLLTTTAENER